MYTLIKDFGWKRSASLEAPPFVVSIVLAEVFFKFHSFTLECIAFMATWYAVSYIFGCVVTVLPSTGKADQRPGAPL